MAAKKKAVKKAVKRLLRKVAKKESNKEKEVISLTLKRKSPLYRGFSFCVRISKS
jgi:chorismate mutase